MPVLQETHGGLSVAVVPEADSSLKTPAGLVVCCHGYGAGGDDLVPLAEELRRIDRRFAGVRFAFPAAPLDLTPLGLYGGRAWWPIDMARLQMAAATGRLRDLRNEHPETLEAVTEQLANCLRSLLADAGLPAGKSVVAGFSQGAMVTTSLALAASTEESPAGLCLFSPTFLAADTWTERIAARGPLPTYIAHGTGDPVLPFELAEELAEAMTAADWPVEFERFQGGHTIDRGCLVNAAEKVAAWLGLG